MAETNSDINRLDSGKASLTAGKVPTSELGTGTANSTTFLRGDQSWAVPAGGSGDSVSVNGTAATDADLDDATPAAPAGDLNVKWQKDSGTPNNISAYVDVSVLEPLLHSNLTADRITAKLTSNQTFTSATLADITGMSFSVTSGLYYYFRFLIVFSSSSGTTGMGVGLTYPSTTIFAVNMRSSMTAAGNGNFANTKEEQNDYIGPSGTKVQTTGVNTTSQQRLAFIEGIIVPSANGTVQLQGATETGSSTVTFHQGTTMRVEVY